MQFILNASKLYIALLLIPLEKSTIQPVRQI
jgi:hypothetical protein